MNFLLVESLEERVACPYNVRNNVEGSFNGLERKYTQNQITAAVDFDQIISACIVRSMKYSVPRKTGKVCPVKGAAVYVHVYCTCPLTSPIKKDIRAFQIQCSEQGHAWICSELRWSPIIIPHKGEYHLGSCTQFFSQDLALLMKEDDPVSTEH